MRRRSALAPGAMLSLLSVLASTPASAGGGPPGGAPPPRAVRAAPVAKESVRDEVTVVGTVEPRLYTKVASRVEGIVATLHVTEGAEVAEGAPLATLELRPLELKRAASVARLTVAQERQRLLEAGEREEVRAGARAAVAEAEARLALARDAAVRLRALASPERPVIDPARADDAEREQAAAEARLEVARQARLRAEAGPRVEEVAEAKAEIARTQAEVDLVQWELDHSVIRSPVAGRVLRTMTEIGQWLGKGDVVCEVMVVATVLARVGVNEREIGLVQLQSDAFVAADAYPGVEFPGKVARILPGAEAPTRSYAVRLLVDNAREGLPRHPLMVGMYVRARIAYGPEREALLVPLDAVVEDALGAAVFVLADGKATRTPVRRGAAHGWRVEVEGGGVTAGSLVAVAGTEGLRDGDAAIAVGAGRPATAPTAPTAPGAGAPGAATPGSGSAPK